MTTYGGGGEGVSIYANEVDIVGKAGYLYGGGGAGGYRATGTTNGGAGAAGIVIVAEHYY